MFQRIGCISIYLRPHTQCVQIGTAAKRSRRDAAMTAGNVIRFVSTRFESLAVWEIWIHEPGALSLIARQINIAIRLISFRLVTKIAANNNSKCGGKWLQLLLLYIIDYYKNVMAYASEIFMIWTSIRHKAYFLREFQIRNLCMFDFSFFFFVLAQRRVHLVIFSFKNRSQSIYQLYIICCPRSIDR